jgi:hypothetical protein
LDDSLLASLTASATADFDTTAELRQLMQQQQQQQQQQPDLQMGSRQGGGSKLPGQTARRCKASAEAADAAAAGEAVSAGLAATAPTSRQRSARIGSRKARRASQSGRRRAHRTAPPTAADFAAGRAAGRVADDGAAAAAGAAGAAAADDDDDDDAGWEEFSEDEDVAAAAAAGAEAAGSGQGSMGKVKGRGKRKNASQAELEEQYRGFQYYSSLKGFNDMLRKSWDVIVDLLCKLVHRKTCCSHNVHKDSSHFQVKQHQAEFFVEMRGSDGVLRCSLSPGWQKDYEVSAAVEMPLQLFRQGFFDREAGDRIIEPTLYEALQRMPPVLGLQPFGRCTGVEALKMAVYSISSMFAADWRDEQERLRKAGEETWISSRNWLLVVC